MKGVGGHDLTNVVRKLLGWLCLLGGCWWLSAQADPIALDRPQSAAVVGKQSFYLQENGTPLTLDGVRAAWQSGRFQPAGNSVLAFGIGAGPVWVRLELFNGGDQPATRRLVVENPWLDRLDVYVETSAQIVRHVRLGDTLPFSVRPVPSRFFAVDHEFGPGTTAVYLRVETPDPIVLPLYLLTELEAERRELVQGYSYGFVYGYLLALLAYNLMLYASLRNRVYLLYGAFLATFLAMNVAYTGHGFAWLWPHQVVLQQWIIPILMGLFGVTGLTFAKQFLDTRQRQPRLHRALSAVAGLSLLLLVMSIMISGNQRDCLLVAFIFVTLFSGLMPLLGLLALKGGHPYARYFLVATLASMTGTLITALSVWGFLPFGDFQFRAVEIGMLVDATVLALALGSQFRSIRLEHLLAEKRASRDPLTDLYNRRSFLDIAQRVWANATHHGRPLSVVMLDIDHFKVINDTHGHAAGDAALVDVAAVLTGALRQGDVVARWGGEEFLLLLPDTQLEDAVALAERLRGLIGAMRLDLSGTTLQFTASFGVVQQTHQETLDLLITDADNCLYRSKRQGRNRTSFAPESPALAATLA